jgi:hypothetical protein
MALVSRLPDPFHQFIAIAGCACMVAFFAPATPAADPFYLGTWKIASAVVAPWADHARLDTSEMKSLTGKTVVIGPKEIVGPRTLACKDPVYRVEDYPADWLFQGAFGEMHDRDKSADPAKIAATLGFRGLSWKVVITGCASELEYHFIDPGTAAIGLNDYVYILKKQ